MTQMVRKLLSYVFVTHFAHFPGTVVTASRYDISTSVQTIDNVICSGTESRLSECLHHFHTVDIGTIFEMECKYCKSIFACPWVMLHLMDLWHFITVVSFLCCPSQINVQMEI